MAITINGSGTIGGVSVGGLPDGIVDTDMLASAAVTSAKVGSLADSNMPAGSVVQVQHYVANAPSISTTSVTPVATGYYVDITPTSASNYILVTMLFNVKVARSGANQGSIWAIWRNGTTNLHGQNGGQLFYDTASASTYHRPCVLYGYDAPATTSSVRYELYYYAFSSATVSLENWGKLHFTAMEIQA